MTTDAQGRPARRSTSAFRRLAGAEALTLAAAAVLGLALVWVAGFAEASAVHDLAHDQRHAIAFPCH